jgi:hypothetical protein
MYKSKGCAAAHPFSVLGLTFFAWDSIIFLLFSISRRTGKDASLAEAAQGSSALKAKEKTAVKDEYAASIFRLCLGSAELTHAFSEDVIC